MTTPVADFATNSNAAIAVFAANEGVWGNALKVRLDNFDDSKSCFDVIVMTQQGGQYVDTERHTVSRKLQKDGFGRQLFLEDKINGRSKYIYVKSNVGIADSIFPANVGTAATVGTGNGTIKTFNATMTLSAGQAVQKGSVVVTAGSVVAIDTGSGYLQGTGVTGTVNYATGAVSVSYTTAPAAATPISAAFKFSTTFQLTGGADGSAPTSAQVIQALDKLANPDVVDFRILIAGGYTDPAICTKIQEICETRKDCFGILDAPDTEQDVGQLIAWRKSTLNINSNYVGMYAPWVKVYDAFNDREMSIPPSGFVAGVFAYTDSTRDPWVPPAGLRRGKVRVQGVTKDYTEGDYQLLYPNGVNLIKSFPGDGVAVWGQRTLQTEESALSRVNVRRLLILIEKSVAAALRFTLFELNNEMTRLQVSQQVGQFMESIKSRGGVYDYKVVCDGSNNTASVIDNEELHVDIYLKPARSAEFIQLQTIITRTSASFDELVATGGALG